MPRTPHTPDQCLAQLRGLADPSRLAGMARVGIVTSGAMGVSMPGIRTISKGIEPSVELAEALWATRVHEAQLLATMLVLPADLTNDIADRWISGVGSWDICDQICAGLIERSPLCESKIDEWHTRDEEFVRRAAFSLIACHTVHGKHLPHEHFLRYLPMIEAAADDERNFVRKAVNWALRQIGKRADILREPVQILAHKLAASDRRSARWIGKNVSRELTGSNTKR